jgi:hypothetical protein
MLSSENENHDNSINKKEEPKAIKAAEEIKKNSVNQNSLMLIQNK